MLQPVSIDKNLMDAYRHRLTALHIELTEAFKNRLIQKSFFERRTQHLNHLSADLDQLQQVTASTSDLHDEFELKLDVDFSKKRLELLQSLNKMVTLLQQWVSRADEQKTSYIWSFFTLLRLRKLVRKVEVANQDLTQTSFEVERKIQSLLRTGSKNQYFGQNSIEDLIKLLEQVETVSKRISQKQNVRRLAQEQIDMMRVWLDKHQKTIRNSSPAMRPPTPHDFNQATARIGFNPSQDIKGLDRKISSTEKLMLNLKGKSTHL